LRLFSFGGYGLALAALALAALALVVFRAYDSYPIIHQPMFLGSAIPVLGIRSGEKRNLIDLYCLKK